MLSDKPQRYLANVIEADPCRNRPRSGRAELFLMTAMACVELGATVPAKTHLQNLAIRGLIFSFAILSADDVPLAASELFNPGFPGFLKTFKMYRRQVNFG